MAAVSARLSQTASQAYAASRFRETAVASGQVMLIDGHNPLAGDISDAFRVASGQVMLIDGHGVFDGRFGMRDVSHRVR